MSLIEVDFPSHNKRDTIYGWIYVPVRTPKAIVQIIHGLGEHSRRYFPLITTLLEADIIVVADDHAGHGKTAMTSGRWVDTGPNAAETAVADEITLMNLVKEKYPDLPYFLYGHSWGSMIARVQAGQVANEIEGLILGGIAAQMEGIEKVIDREALAKESDGDAPVPGQYVDDLFYNFTSRYPDDGMPTAWVARDQDVVHDHSVDPLNNFGAPMSVDFMRGFIDVYDQANADEWYAKIPNDLPVLILAGDQDPVANYGEGAYHVANKLVDSGNESVRACIYPGFRHEVHNEPETRADVEDEIMVFVDENLGS